MVAAEIQGDAFLKIKTSVLQYRTPDKSWGFFLACKNRGIEEPECSHAAVNRPRLLRFLFLELQALVHPFERNFKLLPDS